MSLLDEIRSDLVNESADLSNTLRKAMEPLNNPLQAVGYEQ